MAGAEALLHPGRVDRALEVDRTLLQFWSLRRAPIVCRTSPRADAHLVAAQQGCRFASVQFSR